MITVTGALTTFSALTALRWGLSRALPSGVVTQTKRAGEALAEVGPILVSS